MSVWATTWAYEQTVKPVGRKFVLVAIADYADEKGYAFPSQQTLADMTDQGVSTVREHLKELEAQGLITRERRHHGDGSRTSDRIRLNAPAERLVARPKFKKDVPPEVGGRQNDLTPEQPKPTASFQQSLPPDSGDDPLVKNDPSDDPPVKAEKLIPPYNSPEFLAALADWENHKKEIRKPLRPTGRKKVYKQLSAMGEQRAIAAIEHSIAHGWQGIFEPNGHRDDYGKTTARPTGRANTSDDFVWNPKSRIGG